MYNIGQKVYCYYDHIFPFIKGTIMNNHHNHSISKEINCDVQLPLKKNGIKSRGMMEELHIFRKVEYFYLFKNGLIIIKR